MNGEGGEIRYSTKEVLARIEGKLDMLSTQLQQKADVSQVAANSARISTLERDMQEGKETVKSMLIPQFNDLVDRVSTMAPVVNNAQQYRDRLAQMEEKIRDLRQTSVTQEAVDRYKRWLLVVAVPAILGAAWAVFKIIIVLQGSKVVLP
jgi:hypothetical protein